MTRGGLVGVLALLLGGAIMVPVAPAATRSMAAGETAVRDCARELESRRATGIDRSGWTAPASGLLTARLRGGAAPGDDWDLALFEQPGGRAAAASTSFGAAEQATVAVEAGDRLAVQGCRLAGDEARVPLSLDLHEMSLEPVPQPRISLVSVSLPLPSDLIRLEQLGLDVTHDVGTREATVVTYGAAERAALVANGFSFETLIPDLAARDTADRRQELATAAAAGESALPTGRETYRVYHEYTTEMKRLARQNPEIVRPIVIGKTIKKKPIEGLEIATNVRDPEDGRPAYVQMGGHHAREWPSSEFPMEFAWTLVKGHRSRDPKIRTLMRDVRTFILPVVNVDGFIASRSFGPSPFDDDPDATLAASLAGAGAYRRKNCRVAPPSEESPPCVTHTQGIDLNRNYGAYWGGVGSSGAPSDQNYRGMAPFSEPETRAVREFTSRLHPTVLITNHTFTDEGWWLRQPGFHLDSLPVDEDGCEDNPPCSFTFDEAGMKALGDAMGAATGWPSERAYELGDITGATEDWNYYAQGTYGYTPEARGPNFHGNYRDMVVTEYVGDAEHAGRGVREAFIVAGLTAADTSNHGVISGTAPPGATLRLRKEFDTPTCVGKPCEGSFGVQETPPPPGSPESIHDRLSTRLTVSSDARYEWHVMPSSRPDVQAGEARVPPEETWTMSCRLPGQDAFTREVSIDRGQRLTVNWRDACGKETARGGGGGGSGDGDGNGDGDGDGTGPPDPGGEGPAARRCKGDEATIVGTRGRDRLRGTRGADVILALGGRDSARGGRGADLICGGGGKDRLRGNRGNDTLVGGRGRDVIRGGAGGADLCRGKGGRDRSRGCP